MRAQRIRHVDREIEPRSHPHLQDVEVGLGEFDLLPERRARAAHLRQRGAQIRKQVPEQPGRLRRVGLGQELHGGERVEQEMRLDLRLHQLQLGLHRVLREQQPLGLGLVQRLGGARFAKPEQEEHADAKPDEKGAEGAEEEGLLVAQHIVQRVQPRLVEQVLEDEVLDRDHQRVAENGADRDGDRQAQDGPRARPGRGHVDAIGNRQPARLDGDEGMPIRPHVLDRLEGRDSRVHQQDDADA